MKKIMTEWVLPMVIGLFLAVAGVSLVIMASIQEVDRINAVNYTVD